MDRLISAIAALVLCAAPALSQEAITGTAMALDGDTLLVTPRGGKPVKVRLWGVDVPEMKNWPYGQWARGVLDELIEVVGADVRCSPQGKSHDRVVGRCWFTTTPPGNEISRALIRAGAAVEYRAFTNGAFLQDEEFARLNRKGVWGDPAFGSSWAFRMAAPKTESERRQREEMLRK